MQPLLLMAVVVACVGSRAVPGAAYCPWLLITGPQKVWEEDGWGAVSQGMAPPHIRLGKMGFSPNCSVCLLLALTTHSTWEQGCSKTDSSRMFTNSAPQENAGKLEVCLAQNKGFM